MFNSASFQFVHGVKHKHKTIWTPVVVCKVTYLYPYLCEDFVEEYEAPA